MQCGLEPGCACGCEVITYDSIEADRIARSLDISNT